MERLYIWVDVSCWLWQRWDDTKATLAFEDAPVIQPFLRDKTDNTVDTDDTDNTDYTDNTDDTDDSDDTDATDDTDKSIWHNRL